MKNVLTPLLLTVSCAATVCPQAISDKQRKSSLTKPAQAQPQIRLTTSIAEQKHHCANFVGVRVRLTFTNTGSASVILDKRSFIMGYMVSHDLESAAAKQYEIEGYFDYFGSGSYFNVDPSDMSNFIVLKPGEAYAFESGLNQRCSLRRV